ncbi:MAG: hypothetical protein RBS73_13580 [Prolixibacteraceae bacterium]|jgi:hypothetical protein|nr:hypothetical protein [Prolixibacteraceae bacterium]
MKSLKIALFILLVSCATPVKLGDPLPQQIIKNEKGQGISFEIEFQKGKAHNHPSFVFWIEDLEGNFLQTLIVTQYVATGTYRHGYLAPGKWKDTVGPAERPATLPYWLHKRNVKNRQGTLLPTAEEPVPDAYTAATPKADFILKTKADNQLPKKFRLLMEINQPWDPNAFWNNAKYPENWDYCSSLQPALVYVVTIDDENTEEEYSLNPVGHSHWTGENGKLYTDITSITTAKEIVKQIIVRLK